MPNYGTYSIAQKAELTTWNLHITLTMYGDFKIFTKIIKG